MKYSILSLASTAVLLTASSCESQQESKYPGFDKIEEGLYIQYHTQNENAEAVEPGDILTMSLSYRTENDSVLFDSEMNGRDFQIPADSGQYEGDLMSAFIQLNKGDSATIIMGAENFFTKTAGMPRPDFIDSSEVLYFDVFVKNIQTVEELRAEMDSINQTRMQSEAVERQAYLDQNNITAEPTPSGLIFIQKEEGTGEQAKAGELVQVHYTGTLLDGTKFDSSVDRGQPFQFTLGQGQVIPGWDEGIAMMKEGGKATLIIPSDLAYGANPRPGGPIQPYSTLIFEVELIKVGE